MNNEYYKKLKEVGADGIDFLSITEEYLKGDYKNCKIVVSYTEEEFANIKIIPKTPYLFWKRVDGKKEYILEG